MAPNPLDHSYLLDINLTVHAELADKFYDASELGGYRNKRFIQLQVLLANLISNHQTDPDLYTSVSLDNSYYKPHSRYNSHSIGKGFINLIRDLAKVRKALAKMLCPVLDPIVRVTDWIADLVGKTFFFIIIMAPIAGIPSLSYPLAIYRWFANDHQAFWHGFKKLLWALAPLINISYVWDIWWDVILFIIDLFRGR